MKRLRVQGATQLRKRPRSALSACALLWLAQKGGFVRRLPPHLLRKLTVYLQDVLCVHFLGNLLILQNVTKWTLLTVEVSERLLEGGRYCFVGRHEVIYVGGRPNSASTVLVSIPGGQVRPGTDMCAGRSDPGIVKYRQSVYVFGGFDGQRPVSACEKYAIQRQSWTELPSMPRPLQYIFTPCRFREDIYLPVCDRSSLLTVFTTTSDSFRDLTVHLPMLTGHSVSFIARGELVVVSGSRGVGKWRVQGDNCFTVKGLDDRILTDFSVQCRPVVVGENVYWMRPMNYIQTDLGLRSTRGHTV